MSNVKIVLEDYRRPSPRVSWLLSALEPFDTHIFLTSKKLILLKFLVSWPTWT